MGALLGTDAAAARLRVVLEEAPARLGCGGVWGCGAPGRVQRREGLGI
jgi:hypothetical protein